MGEEDGRRRAGATILLAAGVIAIGASPLLVRDAEVGALASAFWRAALAVPMLVVWAALERGRGARLATPQPRPALPRLRPVRDHAAALGWIALAGLFFAGDLAFWHLSILGTTLANASFITNGLPVLILAAAGWALFGERISRRHAVGMAMASAGAACLFGSSLELDPAYLPGDVAGALTAMFFSAYALALKRAGDSVRPGMAATIATAATAAGLLPVWAIWGHGALSPVTAPGWVNLVVMAAMAQVFGQGAVVFALRRLQAGFAALVILLEPVTTVALGWLAVGEPATPLQVAGGALALAAVLTARPR